MTLLQKGPVHHGGTEKAQSPQRKSSFHLCFSASIYGCIVVLRAESSELFMDFVRTRQ